MKLLLVSLVALFTANSASAAELSAIDCLGTNGVLIKGESTRGEPVRAESKWGVFRKDFIAKLSSGPVEKITYIDLSSEGTEYVLALTGAETFRRTKQEVTGSIARVSKIRNVPNTFVAFVTCSVRFR